MGFEPVEDPFVAQLRRHRLAVVLAALGDGELDQLAALAEPAVQRLGLAGEELLVVGVQDQRRGGDLPGYAATWYLRTSVNRSPSVILSRVAPRPDRCFAGAEIRHLAEVSPAGRP